MTIKLCEKECLNYVCKIRLDTNKKCVYIYCGGGVRGVRGCNLRKFFLFYLNIGSVVARHAQSQWAKSLISSYLN